jgi:hypothetical protein
MQKNSYLIILFFVSQAAFAQLKFVNEFLNIGVGARAHGMFGSVVGNVSDPTAAYWNPSGLTELTAPLSVAAMHANWFGGIAGYDYFTVAKRIGDGRAYGALSFIRMGIDNIPNTLNIVNADGTIDFSKVTEFSTADYAFLVSYAQKMGTNDKFSLGGNVKVIRRVIGTFGSAWGFGSDLSASYKMGNFRLGAMARDITTTYNIWSFSLTDKEKAVFLNTGNDVPITSTETTLPRVIAGLSYKGGDDASFTYLAEIDANLSTDGRKAAILGGKSLSIEPSFGVELGYASKVFLRMGIGNLQRILNEVNTSQTKLDYQPNVGLGISLGRLKIDYALANVGSVSGALASHIFSLRLDLAERK